ncbi:MAG: cytochrome-c oxidase, cbb3-type subunit II, partial [Chitinophagaceae bacterium]|nr:cytochrome-c oxidase, cbb3-type subunit II [Chitinophagaceae bacterium]
WANWHFWIGTLGIVFYAVPMYWAGFMQSLAWKEFTPTGQLAYQFMETVEQMRPFYLMRGIGGLLYFAGVILMTVNLVKTVKRGKAVNDEAAEAAPLAKVYVEQGKHHWHRWIERRPVQMLVWSLVLVAIGGIIEIVPTFMVESNVPTISSVKPYTPLELAGRDIYVREGCYTCHSQMVRPFRSEVARYGEYSKAGEFVYDHPFQWGSKRTGPDLARIGGKYPDSWHFNHMYEPQSISPGSIMPNYPWLFKNETDYAVMPAKIRAMQTLGVPYEEGYDNKAIADMQQQADEITATLANEKIEVSRDKEIIALIAYLQRIGTDIKLEQKTAQN